MISPNQYKAANEALLAALQKALRALYIAAAESGPGPSRQAYERSAEIVGYKFEDSIAALMGRKSESPTDKAL